MINKPDYHGDDFSNENHLTSKAYDEAKKRGFLGTMAERFARGYIHYAQGKTDLYQTGWPSYDYGYELARDHLA